MMTAADEFCRASPTFVAAQRTNQRTGPALEVSGGPSLSFKGWAWIIAIGFCAFAWGAVSIALLGIAGGPA